MSESILPRVHRTFGLQRLLIIDGTTCLAFGVLLLLFAQPLAAMCGLPEALIEYAGIVLLPVGCLMLLIARRNPPHRALVWTVIAGNALWILASLMLLPIFAPTWFGVTFLLLQSAAVGALIFLELRALRAEG